MFLKLNKVTIPIKTTGYWGKVNTPKKYESCQTVWCKTATFALLTLKNPYSLSCDILKRTPPWFSRITSTWPLSTVFVMLFQSPLYPRVYLKSFCLLNRINWFRFHIKICFLPNKVFIRSMCVLSGNILYYIIIVTDTVHLCFLTLSPPNKL